MDRDKRQVKTEGLPAAEQKKIDSAVQSAVEKALKASGNKARSQVVSFVDFIRERGVMGLAVGIVLGTAVTALVRSLVDDIINPVVGVLLPAGDLSASTFQLGSVTLRWGSFVSTFIDFILVALAVYIIFRIFKLEKLEKKPDSDVKSSGG